VSNKAKGSRRERQARDLLLATGHLVTKAGGSLGAFDLIAVPMGGDKMYLRLVQVKSNAWPRPAERTELERLARLLTKTVCPSVEIWRYDYRRGLRVRRWRDGHWEDEEP
jgi:hypothetical protein